MRAAHERVLILAEDDSAPPLAAEIERLGYKVGVYKTAAEIGRELSLRSGPVLVIEGPATSSEAPRFLMAIRAQKAWAGLPIIIQAQGRQSPVAKLIEEANCDLGTVLFFDQPINGPVLRQALSLAFHLRRREFEARHRFAEKATLAAIVESSDDAILSLDLEGTITGWNRGAQRIFGYTAEEMLGQSATVLVPPHSDAEARILERLRRGECVETYETVWRRKDAELIEVSIGVSSIVDPDGRIIGAFKVAREIMARRQVEVTKARLASIVETSDDAIISKDLNGVGSPGTELEFAL